MPSARHILIVNSRSVHQPLFVVGAPHSGADLIGRALKASAGFHVTIGQPSVLRTVYAFARRPSMHQGRPQAQLGRAVPEGDPLRQWALQRIDRDRFSRRERRPQAGLRRPHHTNEGFCPNP